MLNIDTLLKIKRLYDEGKRYDEISLELDIPEYTAKRSCSNDCKILKEQIKRYYDELEEEKKICDVIKSSKRNRQKKIIL